EAEQRSQFRVLDFVHDPTPLIDRADRIIAMGGYNTVCEALSFEKHALIVPRVNPEPEQWIRAQRLRDLGLVDVLHPGALSPAAFTNWVAYITAESPVIVEFALPDRCDYLKLPRRMSPTTVVETEAEHEAAIDHFRIHVRSRILREAALALAPDFVLVDHEPLG